MTSLLLLLFLIFIAVALYFLLSKRTKARPKKVESALYQKLLRKSLGDHALAERLIELEREGFDEPENTALRRLLKLPNLAASESAQINGKLSVAAGQSLRGRPWSGKGITLPHGTELRMEYRGQIVRGIIDEGVWVVEGKRSTSPSDAAGGAVVTKTGERPSLNGWVYWEVKSPGDAQWRSIKSLK